MHVHLAAKEHVFFRSSNYSAKLHLPTHPHVVPIPKLQPYKLKVVAKGVQQNLYVCIGVQQGPGLQEVINFCWAKA